MPQWTGTATTVGNWSGCTTGFRYSRRLEARNESEALAELTLFEGNSDAWLTKLQAVRKAAEEAVIMDAERVGRFLGHLEVRTPSACRSGTTAAGSPRSSLPSHRPGRQTASRRP
jgi:hypothetical protein